MKQLKGRKMSRIGLFLSNIYPFPLLLHYVSKYRVGVYIYKLIIGPVSRTAAFPVMNVTCPTSYPVHVPQLMYEVRKACVGGKRI